MTRFPLFMLFLLLAGCGGGAVVFAPTPLPPDQTPAVYTHPSGAFAVTLPRTWPLYEQHTTTLAAAAFSAPGDTEPSLQFAVVNLGSALDSASFGDVIARYQTQVRADIGQYVEHSREAMSDGSWRMTGVRTAPGGIPQPLNTFIQRAGSLIGVIEVIVPNDRERALQLQTIVNSFILQPVETLQPTDLTTLAFTKTAALGILHVAHWTTPDGVFFITGEVANYGGNAIAPVPVEAVLRSPDGLTVAGAVDETMGRGIPPAGFAPFSLRFGQGQPEMATDLTLTLGGAEWQPQPAEVIGAEALEWTDSFTFDERNRLIISGTVTNHSSGTVRGLRAFATVFDGDQKVIGAAYIDLEPSQLAAGEELAFTLPIPDLGGEPANYLVTVQGMP